MEVEKVIEQYICGIIKIDYVGDRIYVYTKNVFADADQLIRAKKAIGAQKVEVTARYDKEGGLVYVFYLTDNF